MTQEILNDCFNATRRISYQITTFSKINKIEKTYLLKNKEDNQKKTFLCEQESESEIIDTVSQFQSSDEIVFGNVDLIA